MHFKVDVSAVCLRLRLGETVTQTEVLNFAILRESNAKLVLCNSPNSWLQVNF